MDIVEQYKKMREDISLSVEEMGTQPYTINERIAHSIGGELDQRPEPFLATLAATGLREKVVGQWLFRNYVESGNILRPARREFDPFYDVGNDPLYQNAPEEWKESLEESSSEQETRYLLRDFARKRASLEVLENSGFLNQLGAEVAFMGLDPVTYVEMLVSAGALTTARVGVMAARLRRLPRFASASAAGGLAASFDEIALTQTDPTRELEESAFNIMGAMMFGAVLGAAGQTLDWRVSRVAKEEMFRSQKVAHDAAKLKKDAEGILRARGQGGEDPELMASAIEEALRNGGIETKSGLKKWLSAMWWLSPINRAAVSPYNATRVVAYSMSNVPLERTGLSPDVIAPALDSVRSAFIGEGMEAVSRATKAIRASGTKLSKEDIFNHTGQVMHYGDKVSVDSIGQAAYSSLNAADIRAINEAAKHLREPLKRIEELARAVGAFDEDVDLGDVLSYFTRRWDHEKIRVHHGDALHLVREWAKDNKVKMSEAEVYATVDNMSGGILGVMGVADPAFKKVDNLRARAFKMAPNYQTVLDGRVIRASDFTVKNAAHIVQENMHDVMPSLLLADRYGGKIMNKAGKVREKFTSVRKQLKDAIEEGDEARITERLLDLDDLHVEARLLRMENAFDVQGLDPSGWRAWASKYKTARREVARSHRQKVKIEALEVEARAKGYHVFRSGKKPKAKDRGALLGDKDKWFEIEFDDAAHDAAVAEMKKIKGIMQSLEKEATSNPEFKGLKTDFPKIRTGTLDPDEIDQLADDALDYIKAARREVYQTAATGKRFFYSLNKQNHDAKAAATTEKERARLDKIHKRDVKDIHSAFARFTFSNPMGKDPGGFIGGGAAFIKTLNYQTMLGGVTVSSLPDVAMNVLWHGLGHTASSFYKMVGGSIDKLPEGSALYDFMHGLEVMSAYGRIEKFAGLDDIALRSDSVKFGKFTSGMHKITTKLFLINHWNARVKTLSGIAVQGRVMKTLGKGWAQLDDKTKGFLTNNGVNERTWKSWQREIGKHRLTENVTDAGGKMYEWANVNKWDDHRAARAYKSFIMQAVESHVLTPGSMDLPIAFDTQLGSMLLQFKSFGVVAVNRILSAGLSRADAYHVQGILSLIALGHMTDVIKSTLAGREVDYSKKKDLFINAVDRSGVLGTFMDINAIMERMSTGRVGLSRFSDSEGVRRYSDRAMRDTVLGPTIGTIDRLGRAFNGIFFEDQTTQGDMSALRRSLPWQNVFYLRLLLDKIVASSLGEEKIEHTLGDFPERRTSGERK